MIGVVIPAYREQDNISSLIREVQARVPGVRIVVVDDSPDLRTVAAVEALSDGAVKVLHRTRKDGRGSAVLAGLSELLKWGCGPIAEMDADFSHPPAQLDELLNVSRERGLDLLIAGRYLPGSRINNWPLPRRLFSFFANTLARFLLGIPVSDYTNGYRVYSRTAAELVVRTCGRLGKGFISLSEILMHVHGRGLRIGEVPTVFNNRIRGESSVNFEELKNAFLGIFKICWYQKVLLPRDIRRESKMV